jgi:branched-chain amino acid transport system ATP-binding protein
MREAAMTEATMPVLATKALVRRFGALAAVRDVSISLGRGQLHAVIGPNGAGKSTLVNLLSGDLLPSSGQILLDGVDVTGFPAWRLARSGVGRTYQRTNIFPALTVQENARLAAQAGHKGRLGLLRPAASSPHLVEEALSALDRVGLSNASRGNSRSPWRSPLVRACFCSMSRSRAWDPKRPGG